MRLPNPEEQEVIEKLMTGDHKAFEAWFASIEGQLLAHLRGHVDPPDEAALRARIQRGRAYLVERGLNRFDPSQKVSLYDYTQNIVRNAEDLALVERFRTGDHEAFETWYTSINEQLQGYLRTLLDPKDKDALDDIIQNTHVYFVRRGFDKYDPSRGSLYWFVKYIAGLMLKSFYKEQYEWEWMPVTHLEDSQATSELRRDIDAWLVDNSTIYKHRAATQSPEQVLYREEYRKLAAEALDRFFHLAFDPDTTPPHEAIAFGFGHLCRDLDHAAKTPSDWPPRRIVGELSDTALTQLQEQLEVLLTESFERLPHPVADRLRGLREQMQQRVADVVAHLKRHNPHATPRWPNTFAQNVLRTQGQSPDPDAIAQALAQWVVGDTCLRQYYTGEAEEAGTNITEWCSNVKHRVQTAIRREGRGELYERLLRVQGTPQ
jgi:hypothetical protein